MAARVEITGEFIMEAARQPAVIKELRRQANQAAIRADRIASAERVRMRTWVEEMTRPGGRPVANVYADNVDQEWGTTRMPRHRILGRAAEGG